MNQLRKITPPQFEWRMAPCDCDDGRIYTYDDSHPAPAAETCPRCDGEVEIDARCVGCDDERPLNDDGECANCSGLTECVGDPFLRRVA